MKTGRDRETRRELTQQSRHKGTGAWARGRWDHWRGLTWESCKVESPALRDLMGWKHVQERPRRKKKREPVEDTWCIGRGSRWQAHWSTGSAGTEVPVGLVLGQGSFQTAQQSWEWGGWHGDPRLSRKGTQNRRGQGRSLTNTCWSCTQRRSHTEGKCTQEEADQEGACPWRKGDQLCEAAWTQRRGMTTSAYWWRWSSVTGDGSGCAQVASLVNRCHSTKAVSKLCKAFY